MYNAGARPDSLSSNDGYETLSADINAKTYWRWVPLMACQVPIPKRKMWSCPHLVVGGQRMMVESNQIL